MSDPVATLAMTGATTIVAAMVTSTWQAARERTVALFRRRGDASRDIQVQLDRSAARVEGAQQDDAVRQAQVSRWRDDLEDLIRDHPGAQDELLALVEGIQQELPSDRQQWVQQVTAHAGGTAFGALGPGSGIHVHYHSAAGSALPASAGDAGTEATTDTTTDDGP